MNASKLLLVGASLLLSSCYGLCGGGVEPPAIDPGSAATQIQTTAPPSDAIVLFDGADLSQWIDKTGRPARWKVENGYMEVIPGSGSIYTAASFGDVQLHVEWSSPTPPKGSGQGRGNSGIKLMGLYEVQVLDSYENSTYAVGQAGAVYGQYPPRVNASLPPGTWQSFDIIFRAPRFSPNGRLKAPARLTVFHNGVLIHNAVEVKGPTAGLLRRYSMHDPKLPLMLQDHGDPVRYRNIWIRELEPED